jgi:cobalt-zinc-cadmium efflux system protein
VAGSHTHTHGHTHARTGDRRALAGALALIVAFMLAEVVAGLLAGSLALLADAGHMLTDAAALALALFAATLATKPAQGRWTFGFSRVEILAAQINGLTLLLVGVWIVYEAVRRLVDPADVDGAIVLGVALGGIAVNLAATLMLSRASRESLNVRGAFLHVATDLAAFVGTAIAGAVILVAGWNRVDPIASLAVAALMFWSAASLLRESTAIFLERSPAGVDPEEIGRAIVESDGVVEVHDLHVWTVTSGFPALSAHVLVARDTDCHAVRRRLEHLLQERFGVDHTTLQVDHVPDTSAAVELGPSFRRRTPVRRPR